MLIPAVTLGSDADVAFDAMPSGRTPPESCGAIADSMFQAVPIDYLKVHSTA